MNGKDIYKIYAPENAKWMEWVRPVPFVAINTYNRKPIQDWIDRKIYFLEQYEDNTAIFVDLPGKESVEYGIGLAKIGYRPIPLFNGTDEQEGSQPIVDSDLCESALINGAEKLKNIYLKNDAKPAFLVDSYRMNRYRVNATIFDNSWDLYKQDVPTGKTLKENGIEKIIVVGNKIQNDLRKIFFDYQSNGICFYITNGYTIPQKVVLKKTLKEKFEKEEI